MRAVPFWIYLFILFLYSCAQQVAPEGGIKDTKPPELISSVPENFSTNFTGHDIRLDFNEYIALNDIGAQLIISPLLNSLPETKIRKRTLLIHFTDTLLENTTYTMNFGLGLMDNNEGNKLENFQFVFSTGPVIDSLKITGKVIDAYNLNPLKNDLVMLYRNDSDSLPFKERPVYFARTTDSGTYVINNISPAEYKIIGLRETDGDYLYSVSPDEEIAFRDSLAKAGESDVDLRLFKEVPRPVLLKSYSEYAGKAVFVFNTAADSVHFNWITDVDSINIIRRDFSKMHDSVSVWYKNRSLDSLVVNFDNTVNKDTAVLRLFQITENNSSKKNRLTLSVSPSPEQTSIQHIYLPYKFQTNRIVEKFSPESFILKADSIPVEKIITTNDSVHFEMKPVNGWKEKGKYVLFIPPQSMTDIFNILNDSVLINFSVHGENDYGSVKIKFTNTNKENIILQLTDDSRAIIFREAVLKGDSTVEFANLIPKSYRVKLVYDSNENGKWDTGNYLKHIQPEKTFYYKAAILIRANWDVEVVLSD